MTTKRMLVIVAACCIIIGVTAVIWIKMSSPENVFEEIYQVELRRAENKENTVLSRTEYFKTEKGVVKKQESGSFTLKEIPTVQFPYNLQVGHNIDGGGLHSQESKNVVISISYAYKAIDFSVQYRFLFDGGGGDPSVTGEGLHLEWRASKDGETISSVDASFDEKKYKETLQGWGISNSEVTSKSKEELLLFFDLWFDAYPKSKFSKDNLGKYTDVK